MKLTTNKEFDFKIIEEGQEGQNGSGEFYILERGRVIGGLSISKFQNETYVSAETPDVNFTIEEWIYFMNKIKEQFNLDPSQSIMINKHPQSFAI